MLQAAAAAATHIFDLFRTLFLKKKQNQQSRFFFFERKKNYKAITGMVSRYLSVW